MYRTHNLLLKPNIFVYFSFKWTSLFSFQTSFWRWQWILLVPQRVFSQPKNEETDPSRVGNNQETDGEASTVRCHLWTQTCFIFFSCFYFWVSFTFYLRFELLRLLLWQRSALSTHPGVPRRSLQKREQRWNTSVRKCAFCSRENCRTCPTAKTFLMKSLYRSS